MIEEEARADAGRLADMGDAGTVEPVLNEAGAGREQQRLMSFESACVLPGAERLRRRDVARRSLQHLPGRLCLRDPRGVALAIGLRSARRLGMGVDQIDDVLIAPNLVGNSGR